MGREGKSVIQAVQAVVPVREPRNGELEMSEREQAERDSQPAAEPPAQKKSYRKPEFHRERVFETTALACGKIQVTQSQCKFNRKNS